jgi:hypothetical protein
VRATSSKPAKSTMTIIIPTMIFFFISSDKS